MTLIQPYKSIKQKAIKVKHLVEGDIIQYGNTSSGAFHKITKMHGVKVCKKSTRMIFNTNFYAIIREGRIIFEDDKSYNPLFTMSPYLDTVVKIINNTPIKL